MRRVPWGSKEYDVIEKPVPHIVISALENRPTVPGRWGLKTDTVPKACTMDVLHLSPYKGCTVGCEFCSLPQYRGFNLLYSKHGVSVAFEDYDAYIFDLLDKARFVHTFDFGADADALMELEGEYHMTERTLRVLNRFGVPATITSKCRWPESVITELSKNSHSWAQISITGMETIAEVEAIAKDASRIKSAGLKLTARLQPYVVGVSSPLYIMVPMIKQMGFDSLVFGFLRAPMGKGRKLLESLTARAKDVNLVDLYHEKYPGYWQIDQNTSINYLTELQEQCRLSDINLGLCDVYCKDEDGAIQSMQPLFGSCRSCECQNGYGWVKLPNDKTFTKVVGCPGNCLLCDEERPACGIREFAQSTMADINKYQKLFKGRK
jgi:DNA repair photolyase